MSIQRYDIIMEGCDGWCHGRAVDDPCEEGDYVTYADHLAVVKRYQDALKAYVDADGLAAIWKARKQARALLAEEK